MYDHPPSDGSFPGNRPGQPWWPAPQPPPNPGVAPGLRVGAWAIDFGITVVVFGTLFGMTYQRIVSDFPELAAHAAWDIVVSHGDFIGAAKSAWNEVVSYFYLALFLFVVLQFAHQFVGLAWKGQTVGKAVLGIRVWPHSAVQAPSRPTPGQAARRAAVTTFTESGLYALSFVVLLAGAGTMAMFVWLVGILAIAANGLPAWMGSSHQSLSDRAAGTLVIPAQRRVFSAVSAATAALRPGARTPHPPTPYAAPPYPSFPAYPPTPRTPTQQQPTRYPYPPAPYPPAGPPHDQRFMGPVGYYPAQPPGPPPPGPPPPEPPPAGPPSPGPPPPPADPPGTPPGDSLEGPRPRP